MPNIKFYYLYRDGGNYKKYSYVVVRLPKNKTLIELEEIIRSKLTDEQWFFANEWQVPDLFFENFNPCYDPTWHEFESIEYTDAEITCSIPIV